MCQSRTSWQARTTVLGTGMTTIDWSSISFSKTGARFIARPLGNLSEFGCAQGRFWRQGRGPSHQRVKLWSPPPWQHAGRRGHRTGVVHKIKGSYNRSLDLLYKVGIFLLIRSHVVAVTRYVFSAPKAFPALYLSGRSRRGSPKAALKFYLFTANTILSTTFRKRYLLLRIQLHYSIRPAAQHPVLKR
jgi:hypothetical protein